MTFHDSPTNIPDPEVAPKAKRRRFSAEYKRRILEEANDCTEPGQIGALLRREGLYSSHLSTWRRQRDRGLLKALSPKKRGRKRKDALEREVAKLQRENERLQVRLEQAETIIEVQRNSHGCLVWRRRRTGQESAHDQGSRGVGQEHRGCEGLPGAGGSAEQPGTVLSTGETDSIQVAQSERPTPQRQLGRLRPATRTLQDRAATNQKTTQDEAT